MRRVLDNIRGLIDLKTLTGPTVDVGSHTITPVARSMAFGWRGGRVFRTWPCAVIVSTEGRASRLRIIDVTRVAQVAIGFAALCTCWLLIQSALRKERSP